MEDEKNTELENEVTEENVLGAEEYAEDSSDGRDDEFEYDEDGNIIIPDPVFDDDDDEYVIEDDEAEEPQDEPEEREAEEEPAPEEVVEPASDTNAKDEEIERNPHCGSRHNFHEAIHCRAAIEVEPEE